MHSEGNDNGDLLMAVSKERFLEWIMDSGGSYHMTPRRDFLFDFKEFDDGTIKENYVYSLDGWAESGEASVGIQKKKSLAQVWHKRLGHIREAGLHELEMREVHFLRHKNEAFSKFKEWKQLVENQTGRKLKKLRTNNGFEFYNQKFNSLCNESRIPRHLTVAETPQQNGLAERMNRTLLNKVRCLLIQSGLPYSFWTEATVTAAYMINRSPSTALEKKTPMDLCSGHPENYEMLRIFGCVAYSHVNREKLKPRDIKCIFMGYPDGVKGYRLWRLDDVKPKIIISRDVVFNESLMYKDTLKGAGVADSGREVEFEMKQDEGPQQHKLDNYVLVRDRAKRTITIPARYRDEGNVSLSRPSGSRVEDNMAAYAFAIAKEEDTHEPITFQEAINSSKGDYELEQLDVKTAFLHGNLEETIYMRLPPGLERRTGNKVCLLNKSLYGLKQSPRQWYKRFDVYMVSNGFSRSSYDSCVYFKEFAPGMYIYLLLYVDDILIACKSKSEIKYTKGLLQKEFDMKELGPIRKILGMEIVRDKGSRTLKVSQSGYMQKILNNFRVDNGKSVAVPLGAHFKVSLKDCSLDISYVVSIVSRDQGKYVDVDGFVDVDYAKDPDKGRSITRYVFMVHDCVVSWKATLQHVVALSTTEAEYMALTEAVKESIWLRGLLIKLRVNLREIIESKEIEVVKIRTDDNAADAFTKVVPGPKFKYCMEWRYLVSRVTSLTTNVEIVNVIGKLVSNVLEASSSTNYLKCDVIFNSSSANDPKYDIFLSFRGIDTRNTFTAYFHKDLKEANYETFYDDEEIEFRKPLKEELVNGIKASRASVIVLSENYASSTWCLEELALILDQYRTSNHIVFPIFYHVEPIDVRKQQKSFGNAMEKHKRRMEAETNVEEKSQLAEKMGIWKKALTQVANLRGKEPKDR
nr:retrotransposon protein, putative, Ty1-copia subclass [Tanacetum cinerariifolium]